MVVSFTVVIILEMDQNKYVMLNEKLYTTDVASVDLPFHYM